MIRAASAIARFDEASASVIVLLGPWQSIRIEMWQASMLGRYFSSQIGSIMPIDSRPQTWKSKSGPLARRLDDRRRQLVELAGDQPGAQVDADPGRIDAAVDQPGVDHRELRGRDRELDVAGHVLPALAQRPCMYLGRA